jgi:hypothetical protein
MTHHEHPNVTVVREGFEALERGDTAWMDQHLADDVIWHVGGNSKWAGTYQGKAKVLEYFGRQAPGDRDDGGDPRHLGQRRARGRRRPERRLGWLHGLVNRPQEFNRQAVEVDLVAQPSTERLDNSGRVVAKSGQLPRTPAHLSHRSRITARMAAACRWPPAVVRTSAAERVPRSAVFVIPGLPWA